MTAMERAARALCAKENAEMPPDWQDQAWPDYVDDVRAVLTAIREPTPEMSRGAALKLGQFGSYREWYVAMIDAALEEGSVT